MNAQGVARVQGVADKSKADYACACACACA